MKILHVLYALKPSGMECMLHASAESWRRHGVDVHVLANADTEGPFADTLRGCGYTIHCIPWRKGFLHLPAFWRLLRREAYDAVHLHTYRGYPGLALGARLAGIRRIVYTTHSVFTANSKVRLTYQRWRRRIAKVMGVQFVAIGKSVQDNEKQIFKCDTQLIWNWADEGRFPKIENPDRIQARQRFGISPEAFVLVSVGNCHVESAARNKNHRLVLESLAKLSKPLLERTVYLHVGREAGEESEHRLADDLGIRKSVRFMGSQPDTYPFLAAADLFVMPSQREGLGVAVIEAALSGLPLLLTDVPGLRDFRELLPDMAFYTDMAADAFAAVLERIASISPDDRMALGNRIAAQAKERFSIKTGVAQYLAIYKGAR